MQRHRHLFSLDRMSNVLGVSRAGFYKYVSRPKSYRSQEDERLGSILKKVHVDNRHAYGCRRLRDALKDQGESIGRTRMTRLMKEHRIVVKYKKPFRITTQSDQNNFISPNILARAFLATRPNEKWVSDISYIPTQKGFLYLAVIIDLYSRPVGRSLPATVEESQTTCFW